MNNKLAHINYHAFCTNLNLCDHMEFSVTRCSALLQEVNYLEVLITQGVIRADLDLCGNLLEHCYLNGSDMSGPFGSERTTHIIFH